MTQAAEPVSPDPLVREAAAAELPSLAELIDGHPLFERYALTPAGLAGSLAAALERGDRILLAALAGRPLGFAWWQPQGAFGRSPYLRLLVVAAAATGSGIGARLLDAVEGAAFELGRDLFLLVTRENEAAQRLYARRGYQRLGVVPDYILEGVDEVLMRKRRG